MSEESAGGAYPRQTLRIGEPKEGEPVAVIRFGEMPRWRPAVESDGEPLILPPGGWYVKLGGDGSCEIRAGELPIDDE